MIKLSNKSEPIDLITLTEELKKQGHLDDVGGISYIQVYLQLFQQHQMLSIMQI